MIIDCHYHFERKLLTEDELLRKMDECEVDKVALMGVINEPIFQAIEKNPNRFLGWVFVNPLGEKDQVQEFKKWKDNPGFIGVKAHPFWHRYQPIELLPVAEQLSKIGKPLLIHDLVFIGPSVVH